MYKLRFGIAATCYYFKRDDNSVQKMIRATTTDIIGSSNKIKKI